MAVSNKNRNTKTHIVKSQAELEALLAGGTVSSGDVIEFNGVSTTVFNGTTAPTTSTVAFSKGDFYVDTTNSKLYYCANITVTSNVYTYTWVEIAKASDIADVLRYSAMILTAGQKSQARANIDAISMVEYTGTETSYEENVLYYTTGD